LHERLSWYALEPLRRSIEADGASAGRGRDSGYPLPPHRPVQAQLTHTVLTSDMGMFGVETCIGIGLQDLDWWKQVSQAVPKTIPRQSAALAPPPKRVKPDPLHVVAKCFHPGPVTRNRVIFGNTPPPTCCSHFNDRKRSHASVGGV
jgi:hypothetical protein